MELFLAGTEPVPNVTETSRPVSWRIPRIAYPPDGAIIVLDPDIPQENQRVFFEAENVGSDELRWRLNGELLPPGEYGRRWAPIPGRHDLALVDNSGTTHDAVSFVVRGVAPAVEAGLDNKENTGLLTR
jgi:penicillin-binding protein 1C